MNLFQQIWTLIKKDLLLFVVRRWFSTAIRALVFPIIVTFIVSYSKNWIAPSQTYGIGNPTSIRSFPDALAASPRDTVVLVDHGFKDGDIGEVVGELSSTIRQGGKTLHVVEHAGEVADYCRASTRGVTGCYGAAEFHHSPDHGSPNTWRYTLMGDEAFGGTIHVNSQDNDVQIYTFPFQRAIESAIISTHGGSPLPDIQQYPYTGQTEAERKEDYTEKYTQLVAFSLAVALFLAVCGSCFHLAGYMASERDSGMTALLEASMPTKSRWQPQFARLMALHLTFDIIYAPGWIVCGILVGDLVFPDTNAGVWVFIYLLVGISLSGFSILGGAFFKRAQLSGATITIISLILAVAAQLGIALSFTTTTPEVLGLSLIFPPMTFVFLLIVNATFQLYSLPLDFARYSLDTRDGQIFWSAPARAFIGEMVFQIILYPILGAAVEQLLWEKTSSKRKVIHRNDQLPSAITIRNFSKNFYTGGSCGRRKKAIKAVQDLSLNLASGSITTLLGANGSGKSTTMNAIAGIDRPSEGTIELDGRGGLGLCPQQNVLYDDLTVSEHVKIFDRLKSGTATPTEIEELVRACDLEKKANARAKTLSGGQKRKLQLAMAFAGGSRVCLVDEASSGVDPLARRKIWDILLKARGACSILLTTHYLDEAEVLSDHITMLSKGKLKAQGSAVEMKNQFGDGYKVILNKKVGPNQLPGVTKYSDGSRAVYHAADSAGVASVITALEREGIQGYRVHGPTIEDVFLKCAEEIQDGLEVRHPHEEGIEVEHLAQNQKKIDSPMNLQSGKGTGVFKQTWILFCKRWTVLKKNWGPYISALFVSLTAAGMVTRLFIDFDYPQGLPCAPGAGITPSYPWDLSSDMVIGEGFIYAPARSISEQDLFRVVPGLRQDLSDSWENLSRPLHSYNEFSNYISTNFSQLYFGGFYNDPKTPQFAWAGGGAGSVGLGAVTPAFLQNLANNIVSGKNISLEYESFPEGYSPSAGKTLQIPIYMSLALAVCTGLFALYPTISRVRKVRALEYSNGIRSGPLWASYVLFDFVFILVISILMTTIWSSKWHGWYHLEYVFVVFVFYGLAAAAFSYCVSLFVKSQLSAFVFATGIQAVYLLIYFVGFYVTLAYGSAIDINRLFNIQFFTIGLFMPSACLLRALLVTLNDFSLVCRGHEKATYPGEITLFGGPILYLLIQLFVFMTFLILWEKGWRFQHLIGRIRKSQPATDDEKDVDASDGVETPERMRDSNHGLRISHLTKKFGPNTAVEDITFGINTSEKFALLGPNGAGKSTLISLIRGDLGPSNNSGDVVVGGRSLFREPTAVRAQLGVCPQFDAVDSMTVIDHLKFYARARGVPDPMHNVTEVLRSIGLERFAKRHVAKLSGGYKRKLSLAVALIGNPAVLLLDEPSSGMDAAAKRAMWGVLENVSEGRVLVLSTHSMEEADALCDRAGIMSRRVLALGTVERLRDQYGDALYVHVVHRDAPHTENAEMERMREWVARNVPGALVEERTFHGQLRFSVARDSGIEMGQLFRLLEREKEDLGVGSYSVSPATLDQVFLRVVGMHDVREENY